MQKQPSDIIEKSILPWIGKTAKMLFAYMGDTFHQNGIDLSVEQFIILKILHKEDGQPQNNMAVVTERHKASLTRLLDTMEDKHLLTRIPDPSDKRVKRVYLTRHGRKQFQVTLPVIAAAMKRIQRGVTKKEKDTIIAILKKIQKNITN